MFIYINRYIYIYNCVPEVLTGGKHDRDLIYTVDGNGAHRIYTHTHYYNIVVYNTAGLMFIYTGCIQ